MGWCSDAANRPLEAVCLHDRTPRYVREFRAAIARILQSKYCRHQRTQRLAQRFWEGGTEGGPWGPVGLGPILAGP